MANYKLQNFIKQNNRMNLQFTTRAALKLYNDNIPLTYPENKEEQIDPKYKYATYVPLLNDEQKKNIKENLLIKNYMRDDVTTFLKTLSSSPIAKFEKLFSEIKDLEENKIVKYKKNLADPTATLAQKNKAKGAIRVLSNRINLIKKEIEQEIERLFSSFDSGYDNLYKKHEE